MADWVEVVICDHTSRADGTEDLDGDGVADATHPAIGTVYVAQPGEEFVTKERLQHESVHVKQWKKEGLFFIYDYFVVEGVNPYTNRLEQQADLRLGGYSDECGLTN
ncbi:hypothetical protein ET495_00195 [Xylanimonas allomyrinae]|uniref:Uncharacterized protein n=1 Tax=Xylanimonas allomyrinae TaxID=2509459 RepID=A0A4P6EHH9_9MICO|nr:hypothetical protein [Xylanimonas allomyrinae]QAY61980.1 hypothetical protein ET495_00195 [Xylanimonas allomyrinae]